MLSSAPSTNAVRGRVHSWETMGTVDGPGIRYVVFMQGCPLRCLYCHNPDCQAITGGQEHTVEEILQDILRYRSYLRHGGVTVSGGEPLMQPAFVAALLQECQRWGLHTALDTSGCASLEAAAMVIPYADLVLLDIKSGDPELYRTVTGGSLTPTVAIARYLAELGKPVWIRYVLVPGLTDQPHNIGAVADFVATLGNVLRVEVLPFHKMGEYKWMELGLDYRLKETPEPTPDQVRLAKQIFGDRQLPVT
ncbi:MAG: pyruvate formate lyase-activating protein [Oscillatoriales cyanobacterium SM2_2_1]|nr:pyruvate formate lyase-activating protein [Oscillatoriales cyanobacterium SM2_2_1]